MPITTPSLPPKEIDSQRNTSTGDLTTQISRKLHSLFFHNPNEEVLLRNCELDKSHIKDSVGNEHKLDYIRGVSLDGKTLFECTFIESEGIVFISRILARGYMRTLGIVGGVTKILSSYETFIKGREKRNPQFIKVDSSLFGRSEILMAQRNGLDCSREGTFVKITLKK